MWKTVTWRHLGAPEIAEQLADLRDGTLRYVLVAAAVAYFFWHFTMATIASPDAALAYWAIFPVAATGIFGSYVLRRQRRLASGFFLGAAVAAITLAIWLIPAPSAAFLYPVVVLTAVALFQPLAGIVVSLGEIAALGIGALVGPSGVVSADLIEQTAVASLLTLLTAYVLNRNMIVALTWSLEGYRQAAQNAESARNHRAELAAALKQLDIANYRLKRANAALELAWKAADAAERSKTEFVTNISHELRTPLNLIVGFSEMMLMAPEGYDVPLPAAYRGDVNAVYRSAQHVLTLTNDVLDLARVGVGRLALAREPLPLRQVIEDAVDLVREYVTAKGLRLAIDVQPEGLIVTADRLRLRQVLLNLLTNAARFTEQGSIAIHAAMDGELAHVCVTDSGPGIPADVIPTIFTEFHREGAPSAPTPGAFGGIGLGLPISKRLVELHGGQMGVESPPGGGTTFWFTLPMFAEGGDAGLASRERQSPPTHATERLLVVASDDEYLRQFLQKHLRGYRVVAAPDLDSASAMALECRAVAILGDSGDTTERPVDAPAPVLRLPLPHGDRLATALGATAFLPKPVTRAKLRAALARIGLAVATVLVVDDDQRFVRLMSRMLRALPAPPAVRIAHGGKEALQALKDYRPDLLLVDLAMPDLGGMELLAAIAALPHLAGLAVIIVSGQDQVAGRIPLPGRVTIDKPEGLRLDELLSVVEAIVGALDPPRRFLTSTAISADGDATGTRWRPNPEPCNQSSLEGASWEPGSRLS